MSTAPSAERRSQTSYFGELAGRHQGRLGRIVNPPFDKDAVANDDHRDAGGSIIARLATILDGGFGAWFDPSIN
jgi:hypothetical protein